MSGRFRWLVAAVAVAGLVQIAASPTAVSFEEISAQAAVDIVLRNSPTPEKHLIETMPGGSLSWTTMAMACSTFLSPMAPASLTL